MRLGEAPVIVWNTVWNTMTGKNHWLRLNLEGTTSNRDAIGATVQVGTQWNHVTTAVGYASASEKTAHFGLGQESKPVSVRITWPSGKVQTIDSVQPNQVLTVREP